MNKMLSGLCALALVIGVSAACNRTDTDRVGSTPDRTTPPSASPGTATTPGSSSTTTTTSPSGSASGSSTPATTTPGSSSTK